MLLYNSVYFVSSYMCVVSWVSKGSDKILLTKLTANASRMWQNLHKLSNKFRITRDFREYILWNLEFECFIEGLNRSL
jgi:hypothetical protein